MEQNGLNQLFGGLNPWHFIFLLLLGTIGAALAYSLDVTVFLINSRKKMEWSHVSSDKVAWAHDEDYNFWLRYACWIAFHLCMMLICASIG